MWDALQKESEIGRLHLPDCWRLTFQLWHWEGIIFSFLIKEAIETEHDVSSILSMRMAEVCNRSIKTVPKGQWKGLSGCGRTRRDVRRWAVGKAGANGTWVCSSRLTSQHICIKSTRTPRTVTKGQPKERNSLKGEFFFLKKRIDHLPTYLCN